MESMTPSSFDQHRKAGTARLHHWLAGLSLLTIGLVAGWHLSGTPTWSASGENPTPVVTMAQSGAQSDGGSRTLEGSPHSYAPVIDKVNPAVVKIDIRGRARQERTQMQELPPFFRDFFGPEMPRQQPRVQGSGSGVIVDASGYIVTNNHVVEHADRITVTLADGQQIQAELVGTDPPTDLAIVKIQGKDLPTLGFADSDAAEVGDVVLAIGHPFGFGQSASLGIISGKGRFTDTRGDVSYEDFLQTDAPINTGNSGGALVNTRGELVGIPTQIWTPTGGNIGIGFAIPSNMAQNVMEQLLESGKVTRSQLGVIVGRTDPDTVEGLNLPSNQGVLVQEVQPRSAAAEAGLQPYDFLTAFNGQPVRDGNQLRNLVAAQKPGSTAEIDLVRDGKEQTLTVTLQESRAAEGTSSRGPARPESEGGRLGLSVEPLTPQLSRQLEASRESGLVVSDVDPDGPAAEAGLAPGVIIYEANRKPVETPEDLSAAVTEAGSKPLVLLIGGQGQERIITVRPRE